MLSLVVIASMFSIAGCSSSDDSDTDTETSTTTDESTSSDEESSDSSTDEETTSWYAYLYDADGDVIPSATVEIIDGSDVDLTATTDDEGYFSLSGVPVESSFQMLVYDEDGDQVASSTVKVEVGDEQSADENTYGYLYMYMLEDTQTLYITFDITDDSYIGCSNISDTGFEDSTTEE